MIIQLTFMNEGVGCRDECRSVVDTIEYDVCASHQSCEMNIKE